MSDDNGIKVLRSAGHPWDNTGAWDRLLLDAPDKATLSDLIARAKARFWRVWIEDDNRPAAVLYKPSGARTTWIDPILGGAVLPAL